MKKVAKVILVLVSGLLMAWVGLSVIDVAIDNANPQPTHSDWNFFQVLADREEMVDIEEPTMQDIDMFDTSILATWCGEPNGQVRMVGACYYGNNLLEDETGNVWEVEQNLDENGFYLLWLDTLGTSDITDDEVVKVFQEAY